MDAEEFPKPGKAQKEVAPGNIATNDVSRLQRSAADVEFAFARVPENAQHIYSVSLNFLAPDTVTFSDIRAMTHSYLVRILIYKSDIF